MASQSNYIEALLDMGLRNFSVSPAALAQVKATIAARNENRADKE